MTETQNYPTTKPFCSYCRRVCVWVGGWMAFSDATCNEAIKPVQKY